MRKLFTALAIAASVTLGGCANGSLLDLGRIATGIPSSVFTTTINNPIGQVDIVRAKDTYAAALQLIVNYRAYCWSKPYAALMADPAAAPLCEHRRAIVLAVQKQRPKVAAAIKAADNFVRTNQTINAASAISAMWTAVSDFQKLIPRT